MKKNHPVLEYCVSSSAPSRKKQWGFRFRTGTGRILLNSRLTYPSLGKAEKGFVELVKSIATNQYSVHMPASGKGRSKARRRKAG